MTDDTISRQAALSILDNGIRLCDKALNTFGISLKDEDSVKVEKASLLAHRKEIEQLPAAGPEIQWETKKPPKTQDYVLCTTVNAKGRRDVIRGYYDQEARRWVCGMSSSNVIAWAPMPAPFGG